MSVAVSDERGRITLGKDVVDKYGKEFYVVRAPGEVLLIPVPKDPLKVFKEEGKKIPKHLTLADLKSISEEESEKEALGNLTRLQRLRKKRR
jgi:hypothetical protein